MRIELLGVALDLVDDQHARSTLGSALVESDARCIHVVTLNPEYVMLARRDRTFREAIATGDLITADGIGVLLGARLLGGRDAARLRRVTGLNLCDWLAEACSAQQASLFLLGGRHGAAEATAQALVAQRPGLPIAGAWEEGTAAETDDDESLERIASSGARALLVAYGAPGQVTWIARNQAELGRIGVRVAIGVGGAFDYLSGRAPRAPGIVRRLGLEWLYRLLRQPWRWRQQLVLPRFVALLVAESIKRRVSRLVDSRNRSV